MTSRVEAVAEILWHRYSPDHEGTWPSPNADEYRRVASDVLSALTTEPAAPEGRQEAVSLPPYGKMPFDELGRDVSEAGIGVRRDFDFGETYPGHVMTGINFNSLNRIVSKYVTRPAEQAVTEAMVEAAVSAFVETSNAIEGGTVQEERRQAMRAALNAAMEAGR